MTSAQTSSINRQWRVKRFPEPGEAITADLFEWRSAPVPSLNNGEFLVRTVCLSPGPAQRGYLEPKHSDFVDTLSVGEVMRGRGVGEIVSSRHPGYAAGEVFVGSFGWQDYTVQRPKGAAFIFSTRKITSQIKPLYRALGSLGQAGVTAYFGLHRAGELSEGNNVLISAAAGGVGSMAGQIARIGGAAKVVGITGSGEKCSWLCESLGFDAAINYKNDDVDAKLNELFPQGIDLFYDNVGGDILNTGLAHLAMHARVVICGFISTDYAASPPSGPGNYRHLIYKRARMQGFVFFDYWAQYAEAEQALIEWDRDGQLIGTEDVAPGLEAMPDCLASLFSGANRGIKLCQVGDD